MFQKIYNHKWFPRIFYVKPDGGIKSGVTGYFLIEWKSVFSIGILHFKKGSREAYHSHAFNAITWWIKGSVREEKIVNYFTDEDPITPITDKKEFKASIKPKITLRSNTHKVIAHEDTWAFTLRGPWLDFWKEVVEGETVLLTHGRKQIQ